MAWSFVLTDLKGVQLGELNGASSRHIEMPHLRVPAATFQVPLWHPLAPSLLYTDTLLKCYRIDALTGQRDLAFHGPVVSAEENAAEGVQSVGVTAAGVYWRLTKRLLPGSKLAGGISYGSEGALLDLGTIAHTMLTDCNGHLGGAGFTGMIPGTQANSVQGWAGKYNLKNAGEAIAELSAGLSSFEFRVRPQEASIPVGGGNINNWPTIGLLDVAPIIGNSRPDVIFEYGVGANGGRGNVSTYTHSVTRDNLLTDALVSVSGWPDGVEKNTDGSDKYSLVERPDMAAINARGLFEEVVNDAGVLDDGLRTQIADLHVGLRKQPKETVVFTPAINARPAPFVDYNVGDTIRARAAVNGSLRFDGSFRVWGVTVDINESGDESVTLELVQP